MRVECDHREHAGKWSAETNCIIPLYVNHIIFKTHLMILKFCECIQICTLFMCANLYTSKCTTLHNVQSPHTIYTNFYKIALSHSVYI